MKDIMTTGELAKLARVAPRTVAKWFDSGRLRGFRIPGSTDRRILRADAIRFLRDNGMADVLGLGEMILVMASADADMVQRCSSYLGDDWRVKTATCAVDLGVRLAAEAIRAALIDLGQSTIEVGKYLARTIPGARLIACLEEDGGDEASLLAAGYHVVIHKPVGPQTLLRALDDTTAA